MLLMHILITIEIGSLILQSYDNTTHKRTADVYYSTHVVRITYGFSYNSDSRLSDIDNRVFCPALV